MRMKVEGGAVQLSADGEMQRPAQVVAAPPRRSRSSGARRGDHIVAFHEVVSLAGVAQAGPDRGRVGKEYRASKHNNLLPLRPHTVFVSHSFDSSPSAIARTRAAYFSGRDNARGLSLQEQQAWRVWLYFSVCMKSIAGAVTRRPFCYIWKSLNVGDEGCGKRYGVWVTAVQEG